MAVSRINEAGLNVNQYGNRNIIINGAMQVAQRGTSSTGIGASGGYFTIDRMNTAANGTAGRLTMTQESITDLPGFTKCLKYACTTADTSIAAAEYLILQQNIEGQNLQQLAKGTSSAKKLTVSFYVKGNAAATYVCELQDSNSREISKSFSVTTSWERVVLTFDGDTDSGGTIVNSNANGIGLQFWLHAGSNFNSGNAGDLNTSWSAAGTGTRAAGADSFFDSTSRTFFITGLQMEVGDTATDFEHRTFGDELARCQRYYFRLDGGSADSLGFQGEMYNTTNVQIFGRIPKMRAAPTPAVSAQAGVSTLGGTIVTLSSINFSAMTTDSFRLSATTSSSITAGTFMFLRVQSSQTGHIEFDAEL